MRRWTSSAAPSSSSTMRYLPRRPSVSMRTPPQARGDGLGRLGIGQAVVEDLDLGECRGRSGAAASRRLTVSTSGSSGISRSSRAGAAGARPGRRRSRRRRAPRRRRCSARPRRARAHPRAARRRRPRRPAWQCTTIPTAWSIGSSLRSRPAPSRIAARPIASAPQRATEPARGAGTATTTGAASSTLPGPLGEPRVAALGLDQRSSARSAAPEAMASSASRRPSKKSTPRSESTAMRAAEPSTSSRKSAGPPPGQHLARLGDLERVADRGAERRVHRRQLADRRPAGAHADVAHAHRQLARRVEVGHERALPHLDVEQDRVGARGELLRHHRGGDQPGRRDGAGDVAERVEQAVGRHEIVGLRRQRAADARDLVDQLLDAQRDAEARGSTRACRACRPCARGRGRRAWRPACPWRPRAARARSSSCPPRRPSSACRRPCGRATRGRSSRRSRPSPASARASRRPRGRGRRPPSPRRSSARARRRPAT